MLPAGFANEEQLNRLPHNYLHYGHAVAGVSIGLHANRPIGVVNALQVELPILFKCV
jgi:hypothetical protein